MYDAPPRPLVITGDRALLDELLRIAGSVDCEPLVAADPRAARRYWSRAPCVIVGHDAAERCAAVDLPVRRRVAVILPDDPRERAMPWSAAGRLGADCVAPAGAARAWLADWFDTGPDDGPRATVAGVVGGGGGAGASVFAATLAVRAARGGARTLLLDLDRQGCGLDLLLGWEGLPGRRWADLADGPPGADLHELLPHDGPLAVLTNGREEADLREPVSARAIDRVLDAARTTHDLIVADLPRDPGPAATRFAERCSKGFVVVRGDVSGAAGALAVARAYEPLWPPPRLVVRQQRGALTAGEIAAHLRLPLGGTYQGDTVLPASLKHGVRGRRRDRGRLARLCSLLLTDMEVAR